MTEASKPEPPIEDADDLSRETLLARRGIRVNEEGDIVSKPEPQAWMVEAARNSLICDECQTRGILGTRKFNWPLCDDCLGKASPDVIERIAKIIAKHYAAAQPPQSTGWVKVSDRLPEYGGTYIVAVHGRGDDGEEYDGALPAEWWTSDKRWHDLRGWGHDEVTHWQPLPAPPQKER